MLLYLLLSCTADPGKPGAGGQDTACAPTAWFADLDEDGHGGGEPVLECEAPAGYVANADDCDDTDDAVHPRAVESCNGVDDDCDGDIDPPGVDGAITCYRDGDGDGWANPDITLALCACTDGYVDNADDCRDTDAAVHPGAEETWYDGVDGDCAGDDDFDADADGFRAEDYHAGQDCLDIDPAVNPDAYDLCDNGLDDDCDGLPPDCGVVGEVDAEEADLLIVSEEYERYGRHGVFAGDRDGDGAPELLVTRTRGKPGEWSAWYQLLELRADDAYRVTPDDLAEVSVVVPIAQSSQLPTGTGLRWADSVVADQGFDGDGLLDTMAGLAFGADDDERSGVVLWLDPLNSSTGVADGQRLAVDIPDVTIGQSLVVVEEPHDGQWSVAARRELNYHTLDVAPAVYMLEPGHFSGHLSLESARTIYPEDSDLCVGRSLILPTWTATASGIWYWMPGRLLPTAKLTFVPLQWRSWARSRVTSLRAMQTS